MKFAETGQRFPGYRGISATLADFGRPVAVLDHPRLGSACQFGTTGIDGLTWTVDAEYVDDCLPLALVRTIRPLEVPTAQQGPTTLLRSALASFVTNATSAAHTSVRSPTERMHHQIAELTQHQAAVNQTVAQSVAMPINGTPYPALSITAAGYTGIVAEMTNTIVACILPAASATNVRLSIINR